MFKATVNQKTYEIESADNGLLVNGLPMTWDVLEVSDGYFHILYNQKSFVAEIVKTEPASKTVVIKIDGQNYTVELKDKFDVLLEKMGMIQSGVSKVNHIKAPMPGLIIDLKVSVGDRVKTGDHLLVLEAMKMENILKSPGEGEVKKVTVKKGDSVEKGQVLVEFG
jgi:biotin carboxyl carrier protein